MNYAHPTAELLCLVRPLSGVVRVDRAIVEYNLSILRCEAAADRLKRLMLTK